MSGSGMVRLSAEVLERLREFSEVTGVPMARAADEALADWLDTTGYARMQALSLRKAKGKGEVVPMAGKK